jgi:hypothetical protein
VAAHGKEMEVKYRYDAEGYPLGKPRYPASNICPFSPRRQKMCVKMDYTASACLTTSRWARETELRLRSSQQPGELQLLITDDSVKPAVERKYTIKNSIDYY